MQNSTHTSIPLPVATTLPPPQELDHAVVEHSKGRNFPRAVHIAVSVAIASALAGLTAAGLILLCGCFAFFCGLCGVVFAVAVPVLVFSSFCAWIAFFVFAVFSPIVLVPCTVVCCVALVGAVLVHKVSKEELHIRNFDVLAAVLSKFKLSENTDTVGSHAKAE